jgi:hypothetical protein
MTLRPTVIGNRSFVGNAAYVPDGSILPDDILIGVQSMARPPMKKCARGKRGSVALPLACLRVKWWLDFLKHSLSDPAGAADLRAVWSKAYALSCHWLW